MLVNFHSLAGEPASQPSAPHLGRPASLSLSRPLHRKEKGVAQAQYAAGRMYGNGWGVGKDMQAAAFWFGQAAEDRPDGQRGDPHAQVRPRTICVVCIDVCVCVCNAGMICKTHIHLTKLILAIEKGFVRVFIKRSSGS